MLALPDTVFIAEAVKRQVVILDALDCAHKAVIAGGVGVFHEHNIKSQSHPAAAGRGDTSVGRAANDNQTLYLESSQDLEQRGFIECIRIAFWMRASVLRTSRPG